MTFHVHLVRRAEKDLPSSSRARLRLLRSLKRLGHHPYPDGVTTKKLKTMTKRPLYRLRVGDFRVLYEIENEHVYVLRIVKREDLDQAIRQMFRI